MHNWLVTLALIMVLVPCKGMISKEKESGDEAQRSVYDKDLPPLVSISLAQEFKELEAFDKEEKEAPVPNASSRKKRRACKSRSLNLPQIVAYEATEIQRCSNRQKNREIFDNSVQEFDRQRRLSPINRKKREHKQSFMPPYVKKLSEFFLGTIIEENPAHEKKGN